MSNNFNFPVSEYDQYLSFLDLEQHPDWLEAWKAQDKDKVDRILYSMGCDLTCGYEVEVLLHRSRLSKQVEYGPRMSFKMREDKEWKRTGMSIEDQIYTEQDYSLKSTLEGMNRHGVGKCDTVKTVEQLASEL